MLPLRREHDDDRGERNRVSHLVRQATRNPNFACSTAGVTRTVSLGLRRQGFLDYLWLTDYEIVDPVLTGANTSKCKFRAWEYNSTTGSYGPDQNANPDCAIVYWTTGASLSGPVHTNDGLYVCGNPSFLGSTDTYYNSGPLNNQPNTFQFGGGGRAEHEQCTNAPVFGVNNPPPAGRGFVSRIPAGEHVDSDQADGAQAGQGVCIRVRRRSPSTRPGPWT